MGAVIAISRKSIQFPNNYYIENLLGGILDDPLKFKTILSFSSAYGAVDVGANKRYALMLGKRLALAELPLDAFFPLACTAIPCLNNSAQ